MSGVTGIVLCGGHSRRMGQPKAWLPFGDEFLLQRVVQIVGEAVENVIVVAAKGQSIPPMPDFARRVDDLIDDRGPLGGFATGLKAVRSDCETVYLSACDVPLLTPEFINRICSALRPNDLAALLFTDKFHPLNAVYSTSILPFVERRLAEGLLRMQEFINEIPHRKLFASDFADIDPDLESVRNINTPEEYELVLKDAKCER